MQVAIPFWLLRLKSGPLEVFSETAGLRRADLRITVEDLDPLVDDQHGVASFFMNADGPVTFI